jgi:CheY-like chemotaxis protein
MTRNSRPILLVENDPVGATTIKRAFEDLKVASPLVHFADGDEALSHLRSQTEDKPWFILLSLGSPETREMEFLKVIKSEKTLKLIPVVLLAASSNQETVEQSFKLGAAGYIVKPSEHSQLLEAIRTILLYWTLCQCTPKWEIVPCLYEFC